jgi:hypothetical protein
MGILNYFILGYFRLCEVIIVYFWLLKIVSHYTIIGYYSLYYHRLFVTIPLVTINVDSIVAYIFY